MPDNEEFDLGGLQRHEEPVERVIAEPGSMQLTTSRMAIRDIIPGDLLLMVNGGEMPPRRVSQVFQHQNKIRITIDDESGTSEHELTSHETRLVRRMEEMATPDTWKVGDSVLVGRDDYFVSITEVMPKEGPAHVFKMSTGIFKVLEGTAKPVRRSPGARTTSCPFQR